MTGTTTMNTELSASLKRDADELFESMGMGTGTAVRVFQPRRSAAAGCRSG